MNLEHEGQIHEYDIRGTNKQNCPKIQDLEINIIMIPTHES